LEIAPPKPEISFCYPLTPDIPTFIPEINKTVTLSFSKIHCAYTFNCDKVDSEWFLRTRLKGDRIKIPGVGTKKLKNLLIDQKIPQAERDALPLLANGQMVALIADPRFYTPKTEPDGYLMLGDKV